MPKGDVRQYRGGGGRSGGGGSSYDDEGRGNSKNVWEWFERYYTRNDYLDSCLTAITDSDGYQLVRLSTSRFGVEDITSHANHDDDHEEYIKREDSRAHRLIDQKSPQAKNFMWLKFHKHIVECWQREKARLEEEQRKTTQRWEGENERRRIAREALVAKLHEELVAKTNNIINLTAGSLRSDFDTAFSMEEVHGRYEGDYIEDVSDGYISGQGFSEEQRRPGGIKLQVTLSIDLSNSMHYNQIDSYAVESFFELGVALKQMFIEHPNDLYIAFFGFSDGADGKRTGRYRQDGEMYDENSWWADNEHKDPQALANVVGDKLSSFELTKFNGIRSQADYNDNMFTGEDTWISPLFEQIEKWENKSSDPGACRLDVIITDAVLEHPSDIREANKIQERRDGALQTVLLNFMPEDQWSDGTLPNRCVQYHADKDNIGGLLRQIVREFIAVSM